MVCLAIWKYILETIRWSDKLTIDIIRPLFSQANKQHKQQSHK